MLLFRYKRKELKMKYEYLFVFLFGIYLLYYVVAVYNGVIKMKDKKCWYLVHVSVMKIMIATAIALGAMFIIQSYRIDSLQKELSIYESQK